VSAAGNSRRNTIKEGSAGPDPLDIERIGAEWYRRGFSCDPWVDRPGRRWENFVHATDELVIVLEGRMEFEIEGAVRLQNTT